VVQQASPLEGFGAYILCDTVRNQIEDSTNNMELFVI